MVNLMHIDNIDYFLMLNMLFNIVVILIIFLLVIYILFYWTYNYNEFVEYLFVYLKVML